MRIFVIIPLLILVLIMGVPFSNAQSVPDWVKNTAGWWATDVISEREFVNAIEFLVNAGIIQVSSTSSNNNSESVPDWVKNTAGWWATDVISEREFVNAIEFLVNAGIIQVGVEKKCVDDLSKYFDDNKRIDDVCNEHKSSINEELVPYIADLRFNSVGLRGEEFSEEKPSNVFRIFMVGGSTMLSAEVSDDSTIPSMMQKMFDIQNLDREIEVINAGISGGNSISELELIKSKLVNYEPDLVIMYDGWNDLSADYAILRIINNYELACENAIQNNYELIITLQPIAGFGGKSLTNQERINSLTGEDHNDYQLLQAKSSYDYLERELRILNEVVEENFGGVCTVNDLRSIFDDVSGPIYWDQGHVLHAGNLILAEKFFELSMKKIDSSFILEQKFTKIISEYNSIPIMKFLLNELEIDDYTFNNKLKDTTKIPSDKGKFFQLENKFGDASMSFVGKDLSGVDLENLKLSGHDLTGVNLSGQDLRYVDLSDTIIRGANLSDTNLEGKDLSGMDLRGINFSNANLKDVDFTDVVFSKTLQISDDCTDQDPVINVIKNFICVTEILENESIRTNFESADLTNAKFGTSLDQELEQMVYFANFKNANLTNVNINSLHFFGCDFTNAKLDNLTAKQMFIVNSDFNNTEMDNFEIRESWVQATSFNDVQMTNGVFDSITFVNTHFPGTNLDGTIITNLNETDDNTYDCKNHSICKK